MQECEDFLVGDASDGVAGEPLNESEQLDVATSYAPQMRFPEFRSRVRVIPDRGELCDQVAAIVRFEIAGRRS